MDGIMEVYKMAEDYSNSEEAKFISKSLNKDINKEKTDNVRMNEGDASTCTSPITSCISAESPSTCSTAYFSDYCFINQIL